MSARHLYLVRPGENDFYCTACMSLGSHTRAAHFDPALARVEADRCSSRGDVAGAKRWEETARIMERRK